MSQNQEDIVGQFYYDNKGRKWMAIAVYECNGSRTVVLRRWLITRVAIGDPEDEYVEYRDLWGHFTRILLSNAWRNSEGSGENERTD